MWSKKKRKRRRGGHVKRVSDFYHLNGFSRISNTEGTVMGGEPVIFGDFFEKFRKVQGKGHELRKLARKY